MKGLLSSKVRKVAGLVMIGAFAIGTSAYAASAMGTYPAMMTAEDLQASSISVSTSSTNVIDAYGEATEGKTVAEASSAAQSPDISPVEQADTTQQAMESPGGNQTTPSIDLGTEQRKLDIAGEISHLENLITGLISDKDIALMVRDGNISAHQSMVDIANEGIAMLQGEGRADTDPALQRYYSMKAEHEAAIQQEYTNYNLTISSADSQIAGYQTQITQLQQQLAALG